MASIFTRIIAGEIPGTFVFQGERWVALLDIRPAHPGHVLLIPREERQYLADLSPSTQAELGRHLAKMTESVKRATGCPAVNVVLNDGPEAGQEVPHAHWHVVPRWPGDHKGFRFAGAPYGDGQMVAMAERLRAAWAAD